MKNVCVIVNKNWETEPVLNALINASEIKPEILGFPELLNSPKDKSNRMQDPRARWKMDNITVTLYCIQDLMYFGKEKPGSGSNSEEKYRVLPSIIEKENPDLVIAVGTAGIPVSTSLNGSVIIGSNFFVHNGYISETAESKMNDKRIETFLESNVNENLYKLFSESFKNMVENKFLITPRNPANRAVCMASKVFTAISTVNVTDYSMYNWVDHEALSAYEKLDKKFPVKSMETTHGVIKLCTDKPIIWVSAITDLLGNFDVEVNSIQNYTASFNAGIVLGQLFCSLNEFALKNPFNKA